MHLTRYTDYAIRVLLYLAVKGEERTTINEIAQTFSISRNHLMKIVQELNQKGYLTALVRDTEHEMALVECFREDNTCVITPSCRLQPILAEALSAFLNVLDQYTLADLLADRTSQLSTLMRIPTLTVPN